MAKYLDLTGLTTFWTKVKSWVASAVTTNGPSASKTVTGWNEGKMTYGNIQISESQVTNLQTHLNAKAPIDSPAFTGTPTAPTAATGTDTTQIATTAFVNAEIEEKMGESDAMVYKGTLAGGSTGAYGALTPAANKGYTYKVTTAGLIDGVRVEVGDMLICNTDNTAAATANNYSTIAANWDFIQGNQDGVVVGPSSATSGNVALFDGTTGKLIKDSGKTLGKSVPSDAVFTDTKVTAVGNHYTPSADSSAELSAAASGATAAWSIDVVKAVQLQRDAKGHVVGVSVTSGKLPANPNSDTKVTQNSNSEDKEFPLLAKFTNNTTDETNTSKYAAGVTVNPSKKQISATKFKGALEGNAATASKINTSEKIGDTNTPVYIAADGTVTPIGYTIDKSVPSSAEFTDTKVTSSANHYTPAEDSSAEKDASGGAATQLPTASTGTLVQVVTGVKMDAKGHVTGVVSKGLWSPNTTYSNASLGHGYGTCSTAEATAAKVVTLSNYVLTTGGIVAVKFTYGLCASATLNINSKGAKSVFINGAAVTSTTAKMVKAGDIAYFMYDGTQYQFLGTDRMEKDSVTGFSDSGTAGTNAKVTYTKGDGTTGDLMVAITDAEINALT